MLDPQENPEEIKSREVGLDPQVSPGEIKRREVGLDSQVSPEEIMSREVELGSASWTSVFCFELFTEVVHQQRCKVHCLC